MYNRSGFKLLEHSRKNKYVLVKQMEIYKQQICGIIHTRNLEKLNVDNVTCNKLVSLAYLLIRHNLCMGALSYSIKLYQLIIVQNEDPRNHTNHTMIHVRRIGRILLWLT